MPEFNLPHIRICIASYQRPESLSVTLQSLACQQTDGLFSYSITVVDNDRFLSAQPAVANFKKNCLIPTQYLSVPKKNISLARNAAMENSEADYIATIDDDEIANPDWLLQAYKTLNQYDVDMVHAPNLFLYPTEAPIKFQKYQPHSLPNPPTGSTSGYVYSSANALFKTWGLGEMNPPFFDAAFGVCGGEDVDFFLRLKDLGYRAVWCREAVVYEKLPSERCSLRWLTARCFRTGTTASKRNLKRQGNLTKRDQSKYFKRILRSIFFVLRKGFTYNSDFFNNWNDLFFNLGYLLHSLFGILYDEYSNRTFRFTIDKHRYLHRHLQAPQSA